MEPDSLTGKRLTHDDLVTASLLNIAAHVSILKRELREADYKQIASLRPFIEYADKLISELGYADDELD